MAIPETRYYPRREEPVRRTRPIQRPTRVVVVAAPPRVQVPVKRTRVVRKKPVKQSKSKDELVCCFCRCLYICLKDMELDQYMGNEAVKTRLDDQLADYFTEEAKEAES
ncbi:uncharacterized protein BXIN_2413 [Babesia sp. Xinjiang]|uniref:uncharacterized protein n=1 Tax=Babesia sp. Xinjiang TaxID=462227 RepID=UPI000A24D97C|nr:uncharacterized protein BXIN_2413 [Babesia sp. Xinjiang]ORM40735.1 hypothetical protein BXIN_2413 [Babesia sp. Xinjiang]